MQRRGDDDDAPSAAAVAAATSVELIDSWTWGHRPERAALADCARLLVREQMRLCGDASGTTLYSYRFRCAVWRQ